MSEARSSMGLRWDGDQRWIGTDSWGNEVRIDGHRSGGEGSKPSDLLPISLVACVAYTLADVFRKRRETIIDITCSVEVVQDADPPWTFRRIYSHFVVRGTVPQAAAEKWLRIAHQKYCSVSASLEATVELNYTIEAIAM